MRLVKVCPLESTFSLPPYSWVKGHPQPQKMGSHYKMKILIRISPQMNNDYIYCNEERKKTHNNSIDRGLIFFFFFKGRLRLN